MDFQEWHQVKENMINEQMKYILQIAENDPSKQAEINQHLFQLLKKLENLTLKRDVQQTRTDTDTYAKVFAKIGQMSKNELLQLAHNLSSSTNTKLPRDVARSKEFIIKWIDLNYQTFQPFLDTIQTNS